ncbi:MAG: tRNA(Met) cytidine acetyltransferase TmcA domain-containing protein, partial [Methylophaga sp.]|nr:tRNA(Met) cytidine acetyltransferase TmcA domain-containing protein [Methylophaga sp.]
MSAMQRLTVFCQSDSALARQHIRNGLRLNATLKVLWLAATADPSQSIISQAQANQYLGQEKDVLVFDASEFCRPDALAAALGTLRGGGLFFMLLPENTDSLWLRRFICLAENFAKQTASAIFWQSGSDWPSIDWPTRPKYSGFSLTDDQQNALLAIQKVALGHRRRPLLITADRGRGKSTVLGMAAADLVSHGKTQILITAPSTLAVSSCL